MLDNENLHRHIQKQILFIPTWNFMFVACVCLNEVYVAVVVRLWTPFVFSAQTENPDRNSFIFISGLIWNVSKLEFFAVPTSTAV